MRWWCTPADDLHRCPDQRCGGRRCGGRRCAGRSSDPVRGAHRISVTDTGPGIADEELGRIFNAFERGRDTGLRTQEGTGLGLHISRTLAELIGARVGISTPLGVGSRFTLACRPPGVERGPG